MTAVAESSPRPFSWRTAGLLRNLTSPTSSRSRSTAVGTLKTYKGFPDGMPDDRGGDDQRRSAGVHQGRGVTRSRFEQAAFPPRGLFASDAPRGETAASAV